MAHIARSHRRVVDIRECCPPQSFPAMARMGRSRRSRVDIRECCPPQSFPAMTRMGRSRRSLRRHNSNQSEDAKRFDFDCPMSHNTPFPPSDGLFHWSWSGMIHKATTVTSSDNSAVSVSSPTPKRGRFDLDDSSTSLLT